MTRISAGELRRSLAEILRRSESAGERVIIHRRGKDTAALIPIQDLALLERLTCEAEDRLDIDSARSALEESRERIAYSDVRRRLGLCDEPRTK